VITPDSKSDWKSLYRFLLYTTHNESTTTSLVVRFVFFISFFVFVRCNMSSSYASVPNVASHAGGNTARRENFAMRRPQGEQCHFPQPPPFRVYCQPAAFHRVDGSPYFPLSVAYGMSRAATN